MSPGAEYPKHTMNPFGPLRRLLLAAVLLPALVFAAPKKFDIPAQPAGAALQLFGKQASADVTYPAPALKDVRSTEVHGEMEPSAALDQLLTGTGFMARQSAPARFVVTKIEAAKPGSIEGSIRDESGKPVPNAKVAITDSDKMTVTDKRGRFVITAIPAGTYVLQVTAEGLQNARVTDVTVNAGRELSMSPITIPVRKQGTLELETYSVSAKKNDGTLELDPYAVTGQREKPFANGNLDIPRTINDVQPYYVFEGKTIDQSGATNTEDFLKRFLTMNAVAQTGTESPTTTGSSATLNGPTSAVDLRGLGANKTLILVNGRRLSGVTHASFGGAVTQFQGDVNGIPVGSIERIEVLPSSSSGIYGGSALGGVVNIILKKDYAGGELRLTFDSAMDTDDARRSVGLNYGWSLEGGRTHIMFTTGWTDQNMMLNGDRTDLLERNVARIDANAPDFFTNSTSPWLGNLPNIVPASATQTNLTLRNGVVLNSRLTHVPKGTSPTTSLNDLYAGLAANSGKWNREIPNTTQGPTGKLSPFGFAPRTRSVALSFDRQMWDAVRFYGSASVNDNSGATYYNSASTAFTVRATSPISPFTTDVRVSLPDNSTGLVYGDSTTASVSIGADIKLPFNWIGLADYTWSLNRYSSITESTDVSRRVAEINVGRFNPFVDSIAYPVGYIERYGQRVTYNAENRLHAVNLRASGPFLTLPWGVPTLTLGGEYGKTQRLPATAAITYTGSDFPHPTSDAILTHFERNSTTIAGYGEMSVPLVSEAKFNWLHAFEGQFAFRQEWFSVDTGTSAVQVFPELPAQPPAYLGPTLNGAPIFSRASYEVRSHTVGVKIQPVKSVTVRLSQATAFVPPTPEQLIKNPTINLNGSPVNGVTVPTISGGNPDLVPENSESMNFGVIWVPTWAPLRGLRFNVEHYKITQFDRITTLSAQLIVNLENIFPDRVTRTPSGDISLVDVSLVNLYRSETSGFDISAGYRRQTSVGSFTFDALWTTITKLETQYSSTLPSFDALGYSPQERGSPKHKGSATLRWEHAKWNASWTSRYISSYQVFGAPGGPNSVQFANGDRYISGGDRVAAQGGPEVASQVLHDATVGYNFGRSGTGRFRKTLDNISLQLGIRNVFNAEPPMDASYTSNYFLSPYGDRRMRSYWITVKKAF